MIPKPRPRNLECGESTLTASVSSTIDNLECLVKYMAKDLVAVFDCGSTNLTVAVVDSVGQLVTSWSAPHAPIHQAGQPNDFLVWDVDAIWAKLCASCRHCMEEIDIERLCGITVTTWGGDGAPVKADGTILSPPISWQDGRTAELVKAMPDDIDPWEVYKLTGYQILPFSTLLKLRWLHDNEPEAMEQADRWLMMPGIISLLLSGKSSLDSTSAGTMMALDMAEGKFSAPMLEWAGVGAELFPPIWPGGTVAGRVTKSAAEQTGLPADLPVIPAGHDTQFAAIGSGAGPNELILSSGTWEILMQRTQVFRPTKQGFTDGIIIEADAEAGTFNPQLLMIGSAVVEWLRDQFFTDMSGREMAYGDMVVAAEQIGPGCDGVMVVPSFVADTGPQRRWGTQGTILGLKIGSTRDHLYRATLEGLSFQLRQAVEILRRGSDVQVEGIRAVGGGTKNELWNQIRADVCNMPVTIIEQKEATVLGAAMFAFVGAQVFDTIAEAQAQMIGETVVYEPSENGPIYNELFEAYATLPAALAGFYGQHDA